MGSHSIKFGSRKGNLNEVPSYRESRTELQLLADVYRFTSI